MIILIALIDIPQPAHTFTFLKGCMLFAQMDVLDGASLFEAIFEFRETSALNENFENFDIGDKNFIMNSGSYFILIGSILVFNFLLFLLHVLAVIFSCLKCCRKTGRKLKPEKTCSEISYETQKLFLESYFDLALIAFLNLLSFMDANDSKNKGIIHFLETPDDTLCSILSMLHLGLLILFPLVGILGIQHRFESIQQRKDSLKAFV